jgi:hypothetical protein
MNKKDRATEKLAVKCGDQRRRKSPKQRAARVELPLVDFRNPHEVGLPAETNPRALRSHDDF